MLKIVIEMANRRRAVITLFVCRGGAAWMLAGVVISLTSLPWPGTRAGTCGSRGPVAGPAAAGPRCGPATAGALTAVRRRSRRGRSGRRSYGGRPLRCCRRPDLREVLAVRGRHGDLGADRRRTGVGLEPQLQELP